MAELFFSAAPLPYEGYSDSGGSMPVSRIFRTEDPSAVPPRRFTRREAIFHGMKRTGRTASALLPAFENAAPDGLLWRRLLMRRLGQYAEKEAENTGEKTYMWKLSVPSMVSAICL